jgi:hypothetical protein
VALFITCLQRGLPLIKYYCPSGRGYLSNLPIAVCGEVVPLSNITARPYGSHLSNSTRPVYRECFYGDPFLGVFTGVTSFISQCPYFLRLRIVVVEYNPGALIYAKDKDVGEQNLSLFGKRRACFNHDFVG